MNADAVLETPANFQPVPATQNPFLALDAGYIEALVQARGLCASSRDPFDSCPTVKQTTQ